MTTTASRPSSANATTMSEALRSVLEATLHVVNEKVSRRAERWSDELNEFAAREGPVEQAGYQGVKAEIQARNPIWAAIKGAWHGASTEVKFMAVLVVVLLVALAPIPTILIALGLLVALTVKAIRRNNA